MIKLMIAAFIILTSNSSWASSLLIKESSKVIGNMSNIKTKLPTGLKLFSGSLDMSTKNNFFDIPEGGGNSLTGMINIQFKLKNHLEIARSCKAQKINLINLPGFAQTAIDLSGTPGKKRRELRCLWLRENPGLPRQRMTLAYLQADTSYNITYTWNAQKGALELYLNGCFLKGNDKSWDAEKHFNSIEILQGNFVLENISYSNDYFDEKAIASLLNIDFPVEPIEEIGQNFKGLELKTPKMKVVYSNALATQDDIKNWVMEGPGELIFKNGWMEIKSPATPPQDCPGHQTFWCSYEFPDDYLLEWDFKKINEAGLCILFIDAKGLNGEDVLGPKLNPRNGDFKQYWKGDFRNYHFSYSDNGRWVRVNKNPFKTLFCQGYRPEYQQGATYRISILKQKNIITMAINGKICFIANDDEAKYGAPWHGGKMAFRQMLPGHTAYRNLKISVPVK